MCLLATGAACHEALRVCIVCSFCFLGCLPHFGMDKFEQNENRDQPWKAESHHPGAALGEEAGLSAW